MEAGQRVLQGRKMMIDLVHNVLILCWLSELLRNQAYVSIFLMFYVVCQLDYHLHNGSWYDT